MSIKVIGKAHCKDTSKKTGNPYDFIQVHYNGASAMLNIDKVERTRSMFRDKEFASIWRDLSVTYIFGETGAGKTRSVMDKYGYVNCYRVADYKHPFDTYDGQDVLIFEEFRSSLKLADMLNYLDGHPLLLPCRYFNCQACFTKVSFTTNIPPDEQYMAADKLTRQAFWRRIHKVMEYPGVAAYIHRYDRAVDDPQMTL